MTHWATLTCSSVIHIFQCFTSNVLVWIFQQFLGFPHIVFLDYSLTESVYYGHQKFSTFTFKQQIHMHFILRDSSLVNKLYSLFKATSQSIPCLFTHIHALQKGLTIPYASGCIIYDLQCTKA